MRLTLSITNVYQLALSIVLLLSTGAQAQTTEDALEKERLSQSGTAITIIFDDSGSMEKNNRMGQAKEAFVQWLAGIPPETKLSLIALNRGGLVPMAPNNQEAIKAQVLKMQPKGGTPLARTLRAVEKLLIERREKITPYERHIVVIFTDGQDSETSNENVALTVRSLGKKSIETVGIGFHGQGDYMRGHATQYFNASDKEELVQALQQVASEIDQQSDLVITPEIEAAMEKPQAAQPPQNSTQNQPQPQPQSQPQPKKSKGLLEWFGI